MDTLTKQLSDLGWIEIDYNKPLNESISIGDVLITTNMYMFDGYDDNISLDIDKLKSIDKALFTIIDTNGDYVFRCAPEEGDPDDGWFEPQGRIFVKKSVITYKEILVPDFLVDKILAMGGKMK